MKSTQAPRCRSVRTLPSRCGVPPTRSAERRRVSLCRSSRRSSSQYSFHHSRATRMVQMRGGERSPTEAYSCTPQGGMSEPTKQMGHSRRSRLEDDGLAVETEDLPIDIRDL